MAQKLKVFQDPSIVKNVPQTPLEQLQLALEAKAARIASGQEQFTAAPVRASLTSRSVPVVPVDRYGNPVIASSSSPSGIQRTVGQTGNVAMPAGARPASVDRAFAQMAAMPTATQRSALAAVPASGKDQSRLAADAPLGPKLMPALNTQGQIVRSVDPLTNAYGPVLSSTPNSALAAIQAAAGGAPVPMQRPLALMGQRPAAMAPATSGGGYTVQKGDTLWDLARKNGTTVEAIAQASGISNPNKIGIGQQLVIPGASVAAALAPRVSAPAQISAAPVARNTVARALVQKPSTGTGSKGVSAAGQQLRNAFAYAM